jgi:repressor LexA
VQGLTPTQQAVLEFIAWHVEEHGMPPTLRELCKEFGWSSTSAASDVLNVLADKGHLRRASGRARAWRLA